MIGASLMIDLLNLRALLVAFCLCQLAGKHKSYQAMCVCWNSWQSMQHSDLAWLQAAVTACAAELSLNSTKAVPLGFPVPFCMTSLQHKHTIFDSLVREPICTLHASTRQLGTECTAGRQCLPLLC